jgi:hypothetical protein
MIIYSATGTADDLNIGKRFEVQPSPNEDGAFCVEIVDDDGQMSQAMVISEADISALVAYVSKPPARP